MTFALMVSIYFACFLRPFLVEPLLLLGKRFPLDLERFQARQFSVSLHCQKVALCGVENDQLCFVFCSESHLVLRLHVGIMNRFELLIIGDDF